MAQYSVHGDLQPVRITYGIIYYYYSYIYSSTTTTAVSPFPAQEENDEEYLYVVPTSHMVFFMK